MGEAAEKIPVYRVGPGFPPIHTRFGQPGGNPIARSPLGPTGVFMAKVRAACHNGDKLISTLIEGLDSKTWPVRLKACELLLDRGWGKAPAMLDSGDKRPVPLTDEEMVLVKEIYERAVKRGSATMGGSSSDSSGSVSSLIDATVVQPPPTAPSSS